VSQWKSQWREGNEMHFISGGDIASIFRAVRTLRQEKENFEKFKLFVHLITWKRKREGGKRKW
jgi:hypothetical protein